MPAIYVIIQSAMLSISFFLYYNIFFGNVALSKLSKFLIIFIVLNPYYITWASTVLQVAPITLCLAMITYMINKNYEPATASMRIFLKDIEVISNFLKTNNLNSPTFEAAAALYIQSKEKIPITYDTAAICEQLENNNK